MPYWPYPYSSPIFLLLFSFSLLFNLIYTNRAEKEKGQLKSEVEDLQAQIQNIVKNKVLERFG